MSRTAMTQTEALTEVANIIGRDSTSLSADQTTTYAERIKQWLYWSHLTMARLYAFPEMDQAPATYALTPSTYAYDWSTILGSSALANRIRQVMGIVLIDSTASVKLTQKLQRTFDEAHPYPESDTTSRPYEYALYARRFELWPVPNSAYSIRYRLNYFPEDYASSSDTSDYINKDDVIIAGAVTHAYISLQENEDADRWARIFAGRMQQAIGHQLEPVDWEPEGRAFDYNSQRASFGSVEANPLVFFNS